MKKDTVIGLVGVIVLVAAMVGVFRFEQGQVAGLTTASAFSLANETLDAVSGTVAVGATESHLVNVTQANVTRVSFTVTWTPGQGSTDLVNVTVRPPEGMEAGGQQESDSGSVTVTVDVPNGRPAGAPLTLGMAEWKVDVKFVSSQGPAPAGLPVLADTSLSYALETVVTSWQPAA